MKSVIVYLPYNVYTGSFVMKVPDEDSGLANAFILDSEFKPTKICSSNQLNMCVAYLPENGRFGLFDTDFLIETNKSYDGNLFAKEEPPEEISKAIGRSPNQLMLPVLIDSTLNLEPDQLQLFYN